MNNYIRFLITLILLTAAILPAAAFETGQASWYGGKFQGRKTANGEIFDTNKLTAAHKTLPFNTVVKVTNLENEQSVQVRINDRGPFVEGRVIDLSRAAAERIDMTLAGIALVKLEIISLPGGQSASEIKKSEEVNQLGIPDSYILQVASFGNAENAGRCLDKLKRAGLTARLEVAESGMIRVIIPIAGKGDSEAVKLKVLPLGYGTPLLRHN